MIHSRTLQWRQRMRGEQKTHKGGEWFHRHKRKVHEVKKRKGGCGRGAEKRTCKRRKEKKSWQWFDGTKVKTGRRCEWMMRNKMKNGLLKKKGINENHCTRQIAFCELKSLFENLSWRSVNYRRWIAEERMSTIKGNGRTCKRKDRGTEVNRVKLLCCWTCSPTSPPGNQSVSSLMMAAWWRLNWR